MWTSVCFGGREGFQVKLILLVSLGFCELLWWPLTEVVAFNSFNCSWRSALPFQANKCLRLHCGFCSLHVSICGFDRSSYHHKKRLLSVRSGYTKTCVKRPMQWLKKRPPTLRFIARNSRQNPYILIWLGPGRRTAAGRDSVKQHQNSLTYIVNGVLRVFHFTCVKSILLEVDELLVRRISF